MRRVAVASLLGIGIVYSAVHFGRSGVWYPLTYPNIGQIHEELPPVVAYLEHGRPVRIVDNPRQYGPTFMFVLEPLIRLCGSNQPLLERWLYGIQILMMGLGFVCCLLSVRLWLERAYGSQVSRARMGWLALFLGLLWLNFSPLLYMLAVKNVEMWEMGLLSAALYAYLTERRFLASLCIAAASLAKMLPLFFLFYFLLKDRRMLAWCAVSLSLILAVSHWRYGPEFGFQYLPFMLKASLGSTWGFAYHENVSLKGMIGKIFGGWQVGSNYHTQIPADRLALAQAVASFAQFVVIAWLVKLLEPWRHRPGLAGWRYARVPWEWALMTTMMLILSPQAAFEYAVLALPAFSVVVGVLVADVALRRRPEVWVWFGAAVFLVANILPRQVINRMLPVDLLLHWTGNTRLKGSEGYQYFGFPLLGLACLVAALWLLRHRWTARSQAL